MDVFVVNNKIDSKRENATFLFEKETEKTSNFDFRVEKSAERGIIIPVFMSPAAIRAVRFCRSFTEVQVMEEQTSRLETIGEIRTRLKQVIRGKDEVIDLLLNAVLANGHVLLDDVPGVGKTTLAKALALTVYGLTRRIDIEKV